MSRVRPPQDEWSRLNDLERRINNLERSNAVQGAGITAIDASSNVRLFVGEISPGVWGLQIFDASGHELLQLDSAGFQLLATTGGDLIKLDGTGLKCFDGSGNDLIQLDTAGLHAFDTAGHELIKVNASGLSQYDASANLRAMVGHLGDGDYGLQVTDSAGNSQEILPAVQQYVSTTITVTSQTYVSQGGPSVTVIVGASGKVRVEASLFVSANAANVGAWVGLSVDGAAPTQDLVELDSAGGQITSDCGASVVVSGLTAGSHTFELFYKWTSATGNANCSRRSLIVTPI